MIVGIVLLIGYAYIYREQIERVVIACKVYRSQIFTPPTFNTSETRWHRFHSNARFYWDFSDFVVARQRRLKQFNPALKPLVKEIARRQAAGEDLQYSMHIYREVRWRLNFTPDNEATLARIQDLRASLAQPEEQKLASEQDPSDGSWGRGINVWYLKLYYSVDENLECKSHPQYSLSYLDRINSPAKLTEQLNEVLHNDFTRTGVFNREELDETFSAMARMLFRRESNICYTFHPQLTDALRSFVTNWQNPTTGCWGQWMVDRQGRTWKMDDMGMTFHVVSDLNGQVEHLNLIAKRLLQLDRVEFPAGIKFDGHYENHLNWDAVKIFRYAWPTLDETTRRQVRTEISRMLDWCLTNSYQPDGSFKVSDLDDTPGDAYYYGVSFLQEAGYFQSKKRFWTDQKFPTSTKIHDQIKSRLQAVGLNDPKLKDAYSTLDATE